MSVLARILRRITPEPESVNEVKWVADSFQPQPTGVMVDVGAHFGESLCRFASRGWRVLAFEPDTEPRKVEAIRGNLNSQSRLFQYALSNSPSPATIFYRSDLSTGISGLIPFHESHRAATSVEVETLKNVLARENVETVDFLKIDTEGNDLLVLKGMDWCLKPGVILCEFEDAKTSHVGYTYHDLGRYLLAAGYAVFLSEWFPIIRYGAQHRWRCLKRYPCECSDARSWGNFVAVSDQNVTPWMAALQHASIKVLSESHL